MLGFRQLLDDVKNVVDGYNQTDFVFTDTNEVPHISPQHTFGNGEEKKGEHIKTCVLLEIGDGSRDPFLDVWCLKEEVWCNTHSHHEMVNRMSETSLCDKRKAIFELKLENAMRSLKRWIQSESNEDSLLNEDLVYDRTETSHRN